MNETQVALDILVGTSVAVCLGALVGLERQVSEGESGGTKDFPGVRTFAFTGLLGALSVLISRTLSPWMGVAVFVATTCFLVLRYRYDVVARDDPGFTTETAALCTFVVGALAQAEMLLVATIVTIAMAALLRSKRALHHAGSLLAPADMEALIRFLVITGIVLPLLPNEPIDGLYGVLRPRDVWRMVVLISGVSFAAYALLRFKGGSRAVAISGLLAGFVSSTAAITAYGRAARDAAHPEPYEMMAALAATTSFLRTLLMVLIVAPKLLPGLLFPLLTMFCVGLAIALLRARKSDAAPELLQLQNPLALNTAFTFAAIYACVLVALAAARNLSGGLGVYGVSALAAIPGADAPTLSLARLFLDGELDPATATCGILLVAVASTLAKCIIMALSARMSFTLKLAPNLAAIALTGGLFVVYLFGTPLG